MPQFILHATVINRNVNPTDEDGNPTSITGYIGVATNDEAKANNDRDLYVKLLESGTIDKGLVLASDQTEGATIVVPNQVLVNSIVVFEVFKAE